MHYLLKHNMLTDSVKRITEEKGIIKNYYRSLNVLCHGQRNFVFYCTLHAFTLNTYRLKTP